MSPARVTFGRTVGMVRGLYSTALSVAGFLSSVGLLFAFNLQRGEGGMMTLAEIWTVSVSRLAGLLADVALEYADRARFHAIDLAFEQAHQVIDQRLHREHCDVVVAGGANAAFLRGRLQVPLVTVQASGFDLIGALTRARRIHPAVGLVTHAGDLPDRLREFARVLNERGHVT